MSLRCIFCTRPLKRAAVLLAGNPVGPDCARKHNLTGASAVHNKRVERVPRPKSKAAQRDPNTLEMFPDHDGAPPAPDGQMAQ